MTDRTAARVAGGLWLVGLALTVGAGVLHYLTREVPVEYYGLRGFQGVFGLTIAGIGALIASRRHQNPIGWIFVGSGVVSTMQAFVSGYGTYSIARHGGSLPLTETFAWLGVWIWVLIVCPLSTFVFILFPEGRVETRRQSALLIFSAFAIVTFGVVVAMTPGQSGELPIGVENPYAVSQELHESLTPLMSLYLIAVALSIGVLVLRFRRARGELRQQVKWLTYAGAVAAAAIIFSSIELGTGSVEDTAVGRIAPVLVILGFICIPIAAGIAVLRYGLYEIDLVINRTIVYALLAVFITVVYVAVVVGVGALVGSGANTALSIVATAIVALAVQPVRARANRLANRVVFGKRATPYEVLSEFSTRLSENVRPDDVLPTLARMITEATAAERASVWLAVATELRPAATWPPTDHPAPVPLGDTVEIPGSDRVYPVRHEGELLGAIACTARADEPLNAQHDRLLADLASQAGLMLRTARLIDELRASRQRLVAAQDEERRKIERNLHDGAQQQLVALAVNLKLTRSLLDADPARAAEMLEQLRTDATDAVENLRALAHGIYPPLLADRGLVAALQSQAGKATIPVHVEGDGVGRYPPEIESAVYFCVLEALQNVQKYARASSVRVGVRATDGTLSFEVTDDGAGFDPRAAKRGAGLTNMADRLDALGGRLDVRSTPGAGAAVTGWIPARASTDD